MTAVLDNINPLSKTGLKRRYTYEEIANLIGENEALTGPLPNRDATFFKASPEGSFFDGLDSLELLREQQSRIQERQMRELLMRQNLGGSTYSVASLNQQMRERVQPDAEVLEDTNLTEASSKTSIRTKHTNW